MIRNILQNIDAIFKIIYSFYMINAKSKKSVILQAALEE